MINKKVILLVGPSGSGKTVLGRYLNSLGIAELVSHTTRPMRINEINGRDYYFVNNEDFLKLDKAEYTEYPKGSGTYYSLTKNEIKSKCEKNNTVFAITDIYGARQIKEIFKDMVKIVFIKVPKDCIEERMRKRGDKEESIKLRLQNAEISNEFDNWKYADYVLENYNLEKAKSKLKEYVLN